MPPCQQSQGIGLFHSPWQLGCWHSSWQACCMSHKWMSMLQADPSSHQQLFVYWVLGLLAISVISPAEMTMPPYYQKQVFQSHNTQLPTILFSWRPYPLLPTTLLVVQLLSLEHLASTPGCRLSWDLSLHMLYSACCLLHGAFLLDLLFEPDMKVIHSSEMLVNRTKWQGVDNSTIPVHKTAVQVLQHNLTCFTSLCTVLPSWLVHLCNPTPTHQKFILSLHGDGTAWTLNHAEWCWSINPYIFVDSCPALTTPRPCWDCWKWKLILLLFPHSRT